MMTLISLALFAAAFAAAIAVFWMTLVPALPRIGALLAGEAAIAPVPTPVARRRVVTTDRPALSVAARSWRAAA